MRRRPPLAPRPPRIFMARGSEALRYDSARASGRTAGLQLRAGRARQRGGYRPHNRHRSVRNFLE